ncbi:(2,3-dihydroxybenzoyl)adenylate synthase [Streptomyces celluloflavus]|uniref:(2,3-dihydroxybenzoyl)adenylate synthase n=1 Tax=Streptomyces celluloflavus TaxID=58344 RepID=UPI0036A9E831
MRRRRYSTAAADTGHVPWPEEFAARYRGEGYWRNETLGGILHAPLLSRGQGTALVAGRETMSYEELDRTAERLACGLHRIGIGKGDRVVVHLPNIPEFVVLILALFRIGAWPVPALPSHRESEIRGLCEHSEAIAYVGPAIHAGTDYRPLARSVHSAVSTVRHILLAGDPAEFTTLADLRRADATPLDCPPPVPGDVAMLLLSGGTSGPPKLIPRTHQDYAYNIRHSARLCAIDETDTYLAVLPAAHNFTLGCPGILGTLGAGGTVVLAADAGPEEALDLVEREGVTVTALVPPLVPLWIEANARRAPAALSSLRLLQVGGARLFPENARQVRPALRCRLQQVFGMAEGLISLTRPDDPEEVVTQTQGRPMSPGDELRVVDDNDDDVTPGQTGHLLVRGPYTVRGYYRSPEHNLTAFTPDGFYRTGDLARLTRTGHLVVEGRTKDVINRGGEKVPAEEVEGHLLAHPAVHDAALVGIPDDFLGERTCACVVPRCTPPTLTDLTAFLRDRGLAAYKLPDRLEVVPDLPRTGVGKTDKQALVLALTGKTGCRTPRTVPVPPQP